MRKRFLFACGLSGAALIAVACGDDDSSIPNVKAGAPAVDSGSVVTNPSDSGGASDDGGEEITDGGINIDPDAGDEDDAAAAPCNMLLADAAPRVLSKCSSQIPGFAGGELVAGTYFLRQVEDLGSATFCRSQFTPVPLEEQLVLTVDSAGVGVAQTSTIVANRRQKTTTLTLAPPDASSPLALTRTCPDNGTNQVPYTSAVRNAKQVLILELAYGQGGRALYHYEKQ
jgi:hypothetical protein